MADRAFQKTLASLVQNLTVIQGQFSVGASGAISGVEGNGVASVHLNSAGNISITLSDPYAKVLDVSVRIISPASGTPSGITAIELDVAPTSTVIVLGMYAAGSPANAVSGSVVLFSILLRNSSIKGAGES